MGYAETVLISVADANAESSCWCRASSSLHSAAWCCSEPSAAKTWSVSAALWS
ncbi:hypothetical protein OHA72_52915 [Dactylosporangium sp. NBC_01737]|uniref:hypothetical protein n=1 Tax=Dactylosporangium sp. NBC_01737 TaxID=2975959 RepID=UPI002E0D1427|nr:hypothetical protein OHA72_52915 [Dactylosporangium sp. NBC_01737]